MSIVTEVIDAYDVQRKRTALEEARIDKDGEFTKWQMSDVTKIHPRFRMFVLILLSPVILLWALMLAGVLYALGANLLLYAVLDKAIKCAKRVMANGSEPAVTGHITTPDPRRGACGPEAIFFDPNQYKYGRSARHAH